MAGRDAYWTTQVIWSRVWWTLAAVYVTGVIFALGVALLEADSWITYALAPLLFGFGGMAVGAVYDLWSEMDER